MRPYWIKGLLRNAEGEGAGGAGEQSAEGAHPAPNDTISALERRLAQVTQTQEQQLTQQKRDRALAAISQRENELMKARDEAKSNVNKAVEALATAFDEGVGGDIAKAQLALNEATFAASKADDALDGFKSQLKQAEAQQQAAPAESLEDTNLAEWRDKNKEWYGVDAGMTKAALDIHRQIVAAGVLTRGSKEYYDAVDREMSRKYPDRFGGTPSTLTATSGGQRADTRARGVIPRSIADGYRRMGINIDDPEVAKQMVQNREALVRKGILPETPATGEVITR